MCTWGAGQCGRACSLTWPAALLARTHQGGCRHLLILVCSDEAAPLQPNDWSSPREGRTTVWPKMLLPAMPPRTRPTLVPIYLCIAHMLYLMKSSCFFCEVLRDLFPHPTSLFIPCMWGTCVCVFIHMQCVCVDVYSALRFPHTQRVCGIPHTHCQFSVWYLVPHTLSLEFRRVCGTLEIRVCGTIIW